MAYKIRLILITVFVITLSASVSNAVITFQDADTVEQALFTNQIQINSPNGQAGDFELLACSSADFGMVAFNNAAPGWNTEDIGSCGGQLCIMGIFSKFDNTQGGQTNTCSWNPSTPVSVAGILRYSGVDTNDPIINMQCSASTSIIAVAPNIATEDNSVVIRVITANSEIESLPDFDFGTYNAVAEEADGMVAQAATAQPFPNAAATGTFQAPLFFTAPWTACTIAIRMSTEPPPPTITPLGARNVPTISAWGLIATAAVIGVIGFIAIHRRKSVT